MSVPKYLNCPYCPAQTVVYNPLFSLYRCPAGHRFFIKEHVSKALTEKEEKEKC